MNKNLRLYNTERGQKESLPQGALGLYVCGITPYDTTHIGHAFTFCAYDLLIRYLRFLGRKIIYVQNVTDIDDDILIRAKTSGRDWKELGESETKKYLKDMKDLNMIEPDHYVRATDHVAEMIEIVKKLLAKGFAYVSGGSVYFSVKKDREFGQRLCSLNYAGMLDIANERGNFPLDTNKADPLDFVLWQAWKEGEPYWGSPWGRGRPGWHIECSAMSTKYLGQPFALHGGGEDLKFPHHEAEISQSEKANDKKFVLHWMHTAMVYDEGKKMSKSLGNMVFVRDLLSKYEPNVIRWYLLSNHYRKEWEFKEEEMQAAAGKAKSFSMKVRGIREGGKYQGQVFEKLNDDLNSPEALEALFKLADESPVEAREIGEKVFGLVF